MADVFWKHWLTEYLPTLQVRQKWLRPKRNLKVGDLVLVKHVHVGLLGSFSLPTQDLMVLCDPSR